MPEHDDRGWERETGFRLRYVTRYRYDAEVADNLNALRVRPVTHARQRVEEFSVRISPEARLHRHDDYFGTEVIEFEVARPHRELLIDVRAFVATLPAAPPPRPDWAALAADAYREVGAEYLLPTEEAAGHPVLADLTADTTGHRDPLELALAVCELIPDRFEYRRGATYVDSPLVDVLDGGAGVCQDFVHLGLWLLRHHGVAARYVSGYLFTTATAGDGEAVSGSPSAGGSAQLPAAGGRPGAPEPDPRAVGGAPSEPVEVDTHAWIEVLLPDDGTDGDRGPDVRAVWVGVDPTNRGLTGADHIKIGHGRHYADVPPVKGVYRGMANSNLEATVTMTREGPPVR